MRCITCEFTRTEYRRLAAESAMLREVLRAVCGERADELVRLVESRLRAVVEGPPELVHDVDRRFTACLAIAVAESMAPVLAQLPIDPESTRAAAPR
jgi:hypothetical protein